RLLDGTYAAALTAAVILIGSLALSAYRMGEPVWEGGYHGYVLSEYPQNARNYLRWGYLATGFGPVMNPGDRRPPEGFAYRFSHGNVTALLISFSYHLFGVSEWSARLPVIALAALGAATTGLLALRLTRSRAMALVALAFAALTPLQTFYARLPGPHLLATTFALLAFYAYWRWFETGRRLWAVQIFLWLAIGAWTDWIAYFAIPALLLHFGLYRLRRRRAEWLFVAGLAIAPVLLFGSYVLWTWLLSAGGIEQLQERFLFRVGESDANIYSFTRAELISKVSASALRWLTVVPLALTGVWALRLVDSLARRRLPPAEGLVVALFVFGITHNLVFPNRVMIHDFIALWHLAPAVAIAAAIGLRAVAARAARRWRPLAALVVALALALFADQAYLQYRRAHAASNPDNAPTYFVGEVLHELVPGTGRYLAMNILLGYIERAAIDRAGEAVMDQESQRVLARDPRGYDAILVSHANPPPPAVVRELLARYPRHPVAGFSVFLTSGTAPGRPAFLSAAAPDHPQHVVFDGHIEFLGYDMEPVVTRASRQPDALARFLSRTPELLPSYATTTRLTLYWRKISERDEPFDLSVQLRPLVGQRVVLTTQYRGIEDLLPTTEWPVGQIVREEVEITIPPAAPDRRYGLWVGVNRGLLALEPHTSDLPVDAGNRVRVGVTEVRPAQAPRPAPATPTPERQLRMRFADGLELVGYSARSTAGGLVVETFWERHGGTGDYALTLELGQGTGPLPRMELDIPPPRLWIPGARYRATTMFPAYLPNADYQLIVEVTNEDGGVERAPIAPLAWCGARGLQAPLVAQGSPGDEPLGNVQVAPGAPLTLEFDLAAPHDVTLVVAWSGHAQHERIVLQASAVNPAWLTGSTHKAFATIEARRGAAGWAQLQLPRRLTQAGRNTITIGVPERALGGWRALAAVLIPPLEPVFADGPAPYQGWVELDTAHVFLDIPPAAPQEALRALPYTHLLDPYDRARGAPSCYDAETVAALGQETSATLEQVAWDTVSTADIATLQARSSLPLPASLRASLLRRIARREEAVFTSPSGAPIRFLGYSAHPVASAVSADATTEIELYFEPTAPISDDLVIWLHGTPLGSTPLSPQRREYGYENFDHRPSTPTSRWQPGQVYVSIYRLPAPPDAYRLQFGLLKPEPFEVLGGSRSLDLATDGAASGQGAPQSD
ncbi:MAG TPA: glycosyltransferase family 39 protein, partial [Roseiflexaceae bacterium]|nr:glycosyltransferase family 39 protein [Roseiflexaceae bacterium]